MKVEDNEYKRVEKWLYSYKNLDGYIRQTELTINSIRNNFTGCEAISYDKEKLSPTNGFSSQTESEVLKRAEEIEKIEAKKKELLIHKERMDIAISNLNSTQRILFEEVYMNKHNRTRDGVIEAMHISKDTYYRIKKSIVKSVINSLNPDRALREIEEMYTKF